MNKIKILAITGIRSEYDILYPILKKISEHTLFDLQLVVSGAHLSNEHGFTLEKILQDGFKVVDRVDSLMMTDRLTQRPKAIASLISGLTQTVERVMPDYLLVVGDREESIATAIVGNYMDVLVAHVGGGDPVFGNADDPIRMAVSKLAHVHFTTTKKYSDNLIAIGEDKWRIKFCGTPGLDNIVNEPHLSLSEVSKYLGFDLDKYIVVLKHPLSSEKVSAYHQMKTTLLAVERFCRNNDYKAVVIQPNSDPGSADILKAMEEFSSDYLNYSKTLPRAIFINMVRNAKVLVGNSSMGILEAPMHKLPVVNVGKRQQGRLQAGNVNFVEYDEAMIVEKIELAALDENYRKMVTQLDNPYGNGDAAEIVLNTLLSIKPVDFTRWHLKENLVPRRILND